jgi:transposase
LREQGHDVRLIPAQYVKPYVKTNKSDYIDAEAIAEAVGRPAMRFVSIKSDDQLDLQSLHRVRERWVMRRTAVVNQIRGLLLERGATLRKGRRYVNEALPGILAGGLPKLSGAGHYHLRGLQMTPGTTPGLEIASAFPTSADPRLRGFLFPARSAGEERDGTTV